MNKEKVIDALKKLNFTEYEAKIYICLLEQHPQNGNMISRFSGVPSSKVYETLKRMSDKGYVYPVTTGKKSNTVKYSPIPYKSLLEKTEDDFTDNLSFINKSLDKISKSWDANWHELFSIDGYNATIEVLKNEIENATEEIIMNCWKNELHTILPTLLEAKERGVNIMTVTFDPVEEELPWKHFNHAQTVKSTTRHDGELAAVFDLKKAIIFESAVEVPSAVISSHSSTVKVLKNYITHDIYLSRIYADFKDEMKELYGDKLEALYNAII